MLVRKRTRKNYFKNSRAKKRESFFRHIVWMCKLLGAVAFLMSTSFVFVFGYDFFTQCDYFAAKSLTVTGNRRLTTIQVLNQTQIKKDMNTLSVNLSTARKRLLAHSWIADAAVSRKLPDELHIHIREHQPLAILDLGRKYLINFQGVIFKEVSASDPQDLPIVTGLEFSDIEAPGEPASAPFEAMMQLLRLGQQAGTILPNRLIQRIHVDKEIGLTLYTPDRTTGCIMEIKLGYQDYPGKYSRLRDVLLYMKGRQDFQQLQSIDLKSSNRIVVSPSDMGPSQENHKEV